MSLDALLAELDAAAAAEREAVLAEANEQARRIRTESSTRLERRRDEVLGAVRAEEERKALTEIARARSEARRAVLDARAHVAQRVRAGVEERIASSADDLVYLSVVADEVAEALRRAPPGERTLRVAPRLAPRLEERLGASRPRELGVTPDPDVPSGFRLIADGGRVVVDATLEARLRLRWRRHAPDVLGELES